MSEPDSRPPPPSSADVSVPAHGSSGDARATHLVVSWRHVSAGLTVLLLVTAGTLVVVTSGGRALATIALALAVLAFVLQILMFVVQAFVANQQMVQNQELYGRMQGVLARITERTGRTQRVVEQMNERMIEAVLEKGIAQSRLRHDDASEVPPGELASRLAEELAPLLGSNAVPPEPLDQPISNERGYPPHRTREDDTSVVNELLTYPSGQDALAALDRLRELEVHEQAALLLWAEDEIRSRQPSANLSPGFFSATPGVLERGYVQPADPPVVNRRGERLMVLTPAGRAVARLLSAVGPPPSNLREAGLPEIRASARGRAEGGRAVAATETPGGGETSAENPEPDGEPTAADRDRQR